MQRLENHIKKHEVRLITTTRDNTHNTSIDRTKITRKPKLEEKLLYGNFSQQTSEISHEKIWTWLRKKEKREKLNLFW